MFARKRWMILTVILLLVTADAFAAGRQKGPQILGLLVGKGKVSVDHQPAPSGTSLFTGDVVATGEASTAVMSLGSGIVASLAERSEVALSREAGSAAISLQRGAVVIRNPGRQPTRVNVLGASVILQGRERFPALCRIASVGGNAAVFADQGHVEIHGAGAPLILPAERYAQLEAGRPQAAGGGQHAGKVANAIPEEVVQRQGKGAEVSLKVADPVYWEDVVRTLQTGRVRIALQDGSFLNVGARSTMRIIKHDAQTQQTQIELSLGRLRGEVVKLTKAGASHEVRTQTAVIGVVGSVYIIEALVDRTDALCIEGQLQVRNINPAVPGEQTLNPGQSTSVSVGAAPTAPATTASGAIQA